MNTLSVHYVHSFSIFDVLSFGGRKKNWQKRKQGSLHVTQNNSVHKSKEEEGELLACFISLWDVQRMWNFSDKLVIPVQSISHFAIAWQASPFAQTLAAGIPDLTLDHLEFI